MAIQYQISVIGIGRTFPSTKYIATKQHMAVWVRLEADGTTWSQLNVDKFELITNSAVVDAEFSLVDYDMIEVRVADTPDELLTSPDDISTIVDISDEIKACAHDPLYSALLTAEEKGWNSEAEAMNSASFATEPEDVNVKTYTSNGDGTFIATDTIYYSSFHWEEKAKLVASGLNPLGLWSMDAACILPPAGAATGDMYIIEAVDQLCVSYNVGDWLIWSDSIDGGDDTWHHIGWAFGWASITGVTVEGVISTIGDDLARNGTSYTKAEQDAIDLIQDDSITANTLGINPIGGIIMFNGAFANIPSSWQLCDGTNGTPDMTNSFVMGTSTEGDIGTTGGSNDAVAVNHGHGVTDPGHTHMYRGSFNNPREDGGSDSAQVDDSDKATGSSATNITVDDYVGNDGINANRPAFIQLAYIQRMS